MPNFSMTGSECHNEPNSVNPVKRKYETMSPTEKQVRSKVLVINNLQVVIYSDISDDKDFKFTVKSTVAPVNGVIPKMEITAKEDIEFTEDLTFEDLCKIIRRCGILEEYKDLFYPDPEIIINSYTIDIHKEYRFFNEFRDGVLASGSIFI